MSRLTKQLTYANVMATVAVFIALGGGAYAVTIAKNSVNSKSVQNNSLKSKDVKKDTLTGEDLNEATLALTCPSGTLLAGGTCMETAVRSDADLAGAMNACADAGRRLPTPGEYRAFSRLPGIDLAGGEQTSVYGSGNTNAIAVENGISISNDQGFPRPFRCATTPTG